MQPSKPSSLHSGGSGGPKGSSMLMTGIGMQQTKSPQMMYASAPINTTCPSKQYGGQQYSQSHQFPYGVSQFPYGVSQYPYGVSQHPYGVSQYPYGVSQQPYQQQNSGAQYSTASEHDGQTFTGQYGGQYSNTQYGIGSQFAAQYSSPNLGHHSDGRYGGQPTQYNSLQQQCPTSSMHQHGQLVHSSSRIDHSQQRIIAERIVEHEVKVPKKVVREDVVEKIIVVPEKRFHEEVVEDIQTIREKIIEVAMPIIQERIVEVPEIEYVEKIVEVPEIVYQEKIREVPRIEYQERIIEVPRIVMQEKIIEVPEIEYRDIPIEKIVEVPEIREQVVIKEVPIPQYIEVPVPEYVDIHEEQLIMRSIPVPVEAVTTCEFKLPKIRSKYSRVDVPLYVPRFVEVPIPMDIMDPAAVAQAEAYAQQVTMLAAQSAVAMCEVENLAGTIKATNFESLIGNQDYSQLITDYWSSGRLGVDPMSMCYTMQDEEVVVQTKSSQKLNTNIVTRLENIHHPENPKFICVGYNLEGRMLSGGYLG